MMRRFFLLVIALTLAMSHSTVQGGTLLTTLPDPGLVVNGTTVASPDPTASVNPYGASGDFVAYCTDILVQLQNAGQLSASFGSFFDAANGSGTGTLDALIYTGPGGQTNTGGLPDPLQSVSGGGTSSFSGTWGDGNIPGGNTALVSEVLAFLPPGSTIPVFAFDNGENVNRDLTFTGQVDIFDPTTNTVLAVWSFGTAVHPGTLSVPNSLSPPSNTLTGSSNNGQGFVDFWVYAPTMNLSLYNDVDNIFRVNVSPTGLDGAFEELFIDGTIGVRAVPEPGSIVVFSLLGMAGGIRALRRRAA